jgi:hypothetical protein
MTTLLEQLLRWLGALVASVVLLSATLPRQRLQALIQAYGTGRSTVPPGRRGDPETHGRSGVQTPDGCRHVALQDLRRLLLVREEPIRLVREEPIRRFQLRTIPARLRQRLARVVCQSLRQRNQPGCPPRILQFRCAELNFRPVLSFHSSSRPIVPTYSASFRFVGNDWPARRGVGGEVLAAYLK